MTTEGSTTRGSDFVRPIDVVREIGVTPGMRVADFGAGSGVYVLAAASLVGKPGRVFAIDVQKELLARITNIAVAEGYENVEVIWGDVERAEGSKIKEETIDVVVLSNILFQLEDKQGALREAQRILKKDGILAIIDWSDSFGGMGPRKEDVVPVEKAKELCQEVGYHIGREIQAGAHHYGLLCRKTEDH